MITNLLKKTILTKFDGKSPVYVKLQSKLNSPVQVGPGVDFVFPLSQQQEQQEEQQQQEPPPKSTTSRHTRRLRFGMLT